jgi:hypothetical protein
VLRWSGAGSAVILITIGIIGIARLSGFGALRRSPPLGAARGERNGRSQPSATAPARPLPACGSRTDCRSRTDVKGFINGIYLVGVAWPGRAEPGGPVSPHRMWRFSRTCAAQIGFGLLLLVVEARWLKVLKRFSFLASYVVRGAFGWRVLDESTTRGVTVRTVSGPA